MKKFLSLLLALALLSGLTLSLPALAAGSDIELVVATVNNNDMLIMEELAPKFTEQTGIKVKFTILSENEIRSKITQDVALGGGQFDLVTLGTMDCGSFLESGWLEPLDPLLEGMDADAKAAYDLDDVFLSVRKAMGSQKLGLAALPFYSEGTFLVYNKEMFDAKGFVMPEAPTWDEVYGFAKQLNDPANGVYGLLLRGLPGYGENMYIWAHFINMFGAQFYDMDWNAGFQTPEMKNAFETYKKLVTEVGEASPTTCGYTECLTLMSSGKAAMWFDATASGGKLNSKDSLVAGKLGYALAPSAAKSNNSSIGGWGMGVTASSKNKEAAFKFLTWATSKEYIKLVGETKGWTQAPPGTRESTYQLPEYKAACDFADITYRSISGADFAHPAVGETPYVGNSLPNLVGYSSWGETCGQELAAYLMDQITVEEAMAKCQEAAQQAVEEYSYKG